MRQKRWDFFFLSSGGGRDEGLDHLRAASSIEVGQSLPLAFLRRSHHRHTAQLSAGCRTRPKLFLPPTPHSIYSPPSPPRTFFLSGILHHYYSTIHLFTIFTISVHTHTHTFVDPRCPGGERTFGRGCPFSSPICIQDPHTLKKLGNSCC